jgi:ribosomal protein S18 acetylase RimI-like enzyme
MSITEPTLAVRTAGPGDAEHVAAALADGFYDDRIFRWITPDDARRAESTAALFRLAVAAFLPHGAVHIAGDGTGAALWLPPGRELVPAEEAEAFGERVVASAGDEEDAERMAAVVALLEEHHPHDPCWYLNFLGVRVAAQRRGTGGALLRSALAVADRDGQPAYLEATSPDNRRLYERHGFRVVRELTVDDCPPLYAMWREPQPVAT